MPTLGMPELIVIIILAFLFFGPKQLPELAKAIGKSIREFKKSMNEPDEEKKPVTDETQHSEAK